MEFLLSIPSSHCYCWSSVLAWWALKLLLSWVFKVSFLVNLEFQKVYRTMGQISLVIKLFLLVFIAAMNELIQIGTELWSKGLCVALQSAEVLEWTDNFPTSWFWCENQLVALRCWWDICAVGQIRLHNPPAKHHQPARWFRKEVPFSWSF